MPITINGSTGISGIDGSAGTPSVIGSDADTGFFFSAGVVSASLNGVAGNVPLVQGTAQNSTSGTSIDFTGIPSWAKRITVMLQGVSTNGGSNPMLQLGTSGGVEATGYLGGAGYAGATTGGANFTTGFGVGVGTSPTSVLHGNAIIALAGSNLWVCSFAGGYSSGAFAISGGGSKTLSATLDRVRLTTVGGTDTFDAGSINILYE